MESNSDSEEEEVTSKSHKRGSKWHKNKKLWATLVEQPFSEHFVMVETLQGEEMLWKALKNHHKISGWLEARQLGGIQNRRKAATLAKILDCLISTMGVLRAKDELAVEFALRRLAAVKMTDKNGKEEAAREVEEENTKT